MNKKYSTETTIAITIMRHILGQYTMVISVVQYPRRLKLNFWCYIRITMT